MSIAVRAPELQAVQNELAPRPSRWTSGPAVVLYIAIFKLVLHLLVANKYGYMQDELYYIACSEHLDWGYVDHPPLIAFITKCVRVSIGDSLFSLRLLPAIAGAALVYMTGAMARTLGGGRFAQALAALGVVAVPMYLTAHYLLSMNSFEPLFWTGLAYLVLLAVKQDSPRLLIWAGVVVGFGLLNKYSMAVFTLALCIGLLFTEHRRTLISKWFWLGIAVAFVIFLPNLIWLIHYNFPFLQWQSHVKHSGDLIHKSTWEFILDQLFLTGSASPVWLAGVIYFFFFSKGKPYRFLGFAYAITTAFFLATHGKAYYLAPIYAIVLAGGAVAIEEITTGGGWERFRPITMIAIFAGAAVLAPMYLPILPIESLLRYQDKIGMHPPLQETYQLGSPLSPGLALQFGWPELVDEVGKVYAELPTEQRSHATIYAGTYAHASAIDFFGKKYGLPKAISGHLGYFLWGPGKNTSDVIIFAGYPFEQVAPSCAQAVVGAQMNVPYAYDYVNRPVVVCWGTNVNLQNDWAKLRSW